MCNTQCVINRGNQRKIFFCITLTGGRLPSPTHNLAGWCLFWHLVGNSYWYWSVPIFESFFLLGPEIRSLEWISGETSFSTVLFTSVLVLDTGNCYHCYLFGTIRGWSWMVPQIPPPVCKLFCHKTACILELLSLLSSSTSSSLLASINFNKNLTLQSLAWG